MVHNAINSFWSGEYAPHGYCFLWRQDLVWTHAISDILIAAAYFSIPFALVRLVRRRPDVQFGGMFWLFALFIFACGMTHVLAVWNLWNGNYGLEGVVKAITAAASVPTAYLLWKLLPRAMLIPSPSQLQAANEQLSAMVMERDLAVEKLNLEMGERQKAEQALVQIQKIDAIGQLTGGIAHDFNNLLQAISGNLELIARSPDKTESVERWAANGRKAVERGARLANQLLVFARVQQLERVPVEVGERVRGMAEMVRRSIGPNIALELDLGDEPLTVHSEPTQLEMALLNLAINARDAISGQGTLTIEARAVSGDALPLSLRGGRFVRLSVIDDGCGMSPEVAAKAVDPFFTTKDVGKGTGLGLSMAYGFARQSGGLLEIHSMEGSGTRVDLYLPALADEGAGPIAEAPQALAPADPPATGPRGGLVTVVDDDEEVRPILADMLTTLGYEVAAFAHPEEALASADWVSSRVALVDFMMPGMDGAELARRIRLEHPQQRIVFITGYSDKASLDSLAGGNNRVLRKPFTQRELVAVLDSFDGPPRAEQA